MTVCKILTFLLLLLVTSESFSLTIQTSGHSDKEYTIKHNTIESPSHASFMEKHSALLDVPPVAEIFLTKGDTEDTVPLNASTSGEIVVTEEMLHNGRQYNHVVLACNASYPVEWVYENGDGVSSNNIYYFFTLQL